MALRRTHDPLQTRVSRLEARVQRLEARPRKELKSPPIVGLRCPGCWLELVKRKGKTCVWCGFRFDAVKPKLAPVLKTLKKSKIFHQR
jgi:hypothetical protein